MNEIKIKVGNIKIVIKIYKKERKKIEQGTAIWSKLFAVLLIYGTSNLMPWSK